MGKKDKGEKRKRVEFEDTEDAENNIDPELEKEMAAVKAIRAEKQHNESQGSENNRNNDTYNREGLLKCLTDFETNELPFIQTMEINEFEFPSTNELDDMEREMNFYNHAVMAVKSGQSLLQSLGVPLQRPHDYFCEHIKSDAHMDKIKDRLILEEKKIEAFEKRKNREQSKKFNKQLSLKKKSEKNAETNNFNRDIEKLKKSKDMNKDEKLERILNSDHSKKRGGDRDDFGGKSNKRKAMDKKYGFGGKDKIKKMKFNDSKSLNDMKDFNPRGGKSIQRAVPRRGGAARGGRQAGKKGTNRPGKSARASARAGRKK